MNEIVAVAVVLVSTAVVVVVVCSVAAIRSYLVQPFLIFVEFVGQPIHLMIYFVLNCHRTNDQFHGFVLLPANVD